MPPLEKVIADSVKNYDPKKNDNSWILAAWRTFALALLEYRQGDFATSINWLEKCSAYPDQTPSCVASAHILRSMNQFQLDDVAHAKAELKTGQEMVDNIFHNKLELGDNKTGKLGGWIMARIFLREAQNLSNASINVDGDVVQ
jgi:hypothetical protein